MFWKSMSDMTKRVNRRKQGGGVGGRGGGVFNIMQGQASLLFTAIAVQKVTCSAYRAAHCNMYVCVREKEREREAGECYLSCKTGLVS